MTLRNMVTLEHDGRASAPEIFNLTKTGIALRCQMMGEEGICDWLWTGTAGISY
jgi:hypothetical protein